MSRITNIPTAGLDNKVHCGGPLVKHPIFYMALGAGSVIALVLLLLIG